jgi:hypothetical protein
MTGLTIAKLLKAHPGLVALVSAANIFPYVAQEETPLPLIIYTVDSVSPDYTKDGWAEDLVTFSVICLSDDYASLQSIAAEVRDALELQKDTNTKTIRMTGQVEGYNLAENVFLNKQAFEIEVY